MATLEAKDEETRKCSHCSFTGPISTFPRKANLEYKKKCAKCDGRDRKQAETRKLNASKENAGPGNQVPKRDSVPSTTGPLSEMGWKEAAELIGQHKEHAFQFDAIVHLDSLLAEVRPEDEPSDSAPRVETAVMARQIAREVRELTGYRFIYRNYQDIESGARTFVFFCAQLKGQETKQRLVEDPKKRCMRMQMDRFDCNGWLRVTFHENDASVARVCVGHHHAHTKYLDINLGSKEKAMIQDLKHLAPSKIWDKILAENPDNEFTEKQVYHEWTRLNEKEWKLDPDQVKSAEKLIKSVEDFTTVGIPITPRPGVHAVAFGLKEPIDAIGDEVMEVAMDSTWKTNAAGYELYALVAELNGSAIPLAFLFTTSDGNAEAGYKDPLLQEFLDFIAKHCPNIKFTDSDKETAEINAFQVKIPQGKHQLCYWHSIRYIEHRLGEDKPPAFYDPRRAHQIFDFIDPTWAPGITSGLVEDGVHPDSVEDKMPPLKIHIDLRRMENIIPSTSEPTQKPSQTCRPPVMILKLGETRTPIYPAPPSTRTGDLPIFCPKEHRTTIIEKFRTHLHQHPSIPTDDAAGTMLTAEEIHYRATKDIYDFCFGRDLSQVWAYLWNRWYTPKQWILWARASCDAIPRLKTTMIVESLWRQIKRRDLPQFNRPRLDLVTNVVLKVLLPRINRKIAYLCDQRRLGRPKALAPWQSSFAQDWHDMSKPDALRSMEKELACLKNTSSKGPARAERLAEIEAERDRPRGKYHTSVERWTCSCRSYLISRFLLCKHLVREANRLTNNAPCQNYRFFLTLRRNHYPPYYTIPGIHDLDDSGPAQDDDTHVRDIIVLGGQVRRGKGAMKQTSDPVPIGVGATESDDLEQVHQQEREHQGTESDPIEIDTDGGSPGGYTADEGPQRIFYSEAQVEHLKRCFDDMIGVARAPSGVHPKMAEVLNQVFKQVEDVGGDIGREKRRRTGSRTWKDSSRNTLFLD